MLERPDIPDERLIAILQAEYGLPCVELTFLPLGADENTAVYRAIARDGTSQFAKLRWGDFIENSVAVPQLLHSQGIRAIIPPLMTIAGRLYSESDSFVMILYPYISGANGFEIALTDRQWNEFGATLRRLHTVVVPESLSSGIRREDFSPRWREKVRAFLEPETGRIYRDPVARKLAAFLEKKRQAILDLVDQSERRAQTLITRPPEFVLCHTDVHAGSVLIGDDGELYIVDWDNPLLAPKERDLMFVGGAQGFIGRTSQEEEDLFYQGYGAVKIDPVALAYYRFERIVEDIALFCAQLLLDDSGGVDREQALYYLMSNFDPGGPIEAAYRTIDQAS
jgi:spectinomycin phosphotransferase